MTKRQEVQAADHKQQEALTKSMAARRAVEDAQIKLKTLKQQLNDADAAFVEAVIEFNRLSNIPVKSTTTRERAPITPKENVNNGSSRVEDRTHA